jgi:hypothetical protein
MSYPSRFNQPLRFCPIAKTRRSRARVFSTSISLVTLDEDDLSSLPLRLSYLLFSDPTTAGFPPSPPSTSPSTHWHLTDTNLFLHTSTVLHFRCNTALVECYKHVYSAPLPPPPYSSDTVPMSTELCSMILLN